VGGGRGGEELDRKGGEERRGAMSDLLEKIWQGNVNEQGELDQEGYDHDTKTGLTTATSRNKGDILGNAITADDTKAVDDDDSNIKAPDAIDYSREEDVAEEDDKANDIYAEKAKRMLAQKNQQQKPGLYSQHLKWLCIVNVPGH
jgi:hypothetical protein